jgi:cyanophycinase-like exopeptidase
MDEVRIAPGPGRIAILGSGETAPAGRRVLFDLLRQTAEPRAIAVLDTPAGFQPNHERVAGKVAEFIAASLAELRPQPRVIETRRDAGGPGEREAQTAALREIAAARCIVAGPGSPTYMVRELAGTPYVEAIAQAHAQGAALYLASAASIAVGTYALPVYEIFKAGEDPHWTAGLDLFSRLGLRLAIVPHWNNAEGGAELDTSCCFIGRERFARLAEALPEDVAVLGVDEHTACVLDFTTQTARVAGRGSVHVLRAGEIAEFSAREGFPLDLLRMRGERADTMVAAFAAWEAADPEPQEPARAREDAATPATAAVPAREPRIPVPVPPQLVEALLRLRGDLRAARQFALADTVRDSLAAEGIVIEDTREGPRWHVATDQADCISTSDDEQ